MCSTLQMLTNIENRLEELFEQIELLPPDKVEAAEKVQRFIWLLWYFIEGFSQSSSWNDFLLFYEATASRLKLLLYLRVRWADGNKIKPIEKIQGQIFDKSRLTNKPNFVWVCSAFGWIGGLKEVIFHRVINNDKKITIG